MSDYIDTRAGWRELDVVTPDSIYQLAEYDPAGGSVVRAWVREVPVPPLPTEPYTVIRATLKDGEEADLLLAASGHWGAAYGTSKVWASADDIARVGLITGFEVLAEPRAVTAKTVLDRIAGEPWAREVDLTKWRREFGVSS